MQKKHFIWMRNLPINFCKFWNIHPTPYTGLRTTKSRGRLPNKCANKTGHLFRGVTHLNSAISVGLPSLASHLIPLTSVISIECWFQGVPNWGVVCSPTRNGSSPGRNSPSSRRWARGSSGGCSGPRRSTSQESQVRI